MPSWVSNIMEKVKTSTDSIKRDELNGLGWKFKHRKNRHWQIGWSNAVWHSEIHLQPVAFGLFCKQFKIQVHTLLCLWQNRWWGYADGDCRKLREAILKSSQHSILLTGMFWKAFIKQRFGLPERHHNIQNR